MRGTRVERKNLRIPLRTHRHPRTYSAWAPLCISGAALGPLTMASSGSQGSPAAFVCGAVTVVRRNHFPIAAKPSGNNHPLAYGDIKYVVSVKLCSECFYVEFLS